MKTKEFKGIISRSTAKDNSLILNIIEYSCIPLSSWFETHSRLQIKTTDNQTIISRFYYLMIFLLSMLRAFGEIFTPTFTTGFGLSEFPS